MPQRDETGETTKLSAMRSKARAERRGKKGDAHAPVLKGQDDKRLLVCAQRVEQVVAVAIHLVR